MTNGNNFDVVNLFDYFIYCSRYTLFPSVIIKHNYRSFVHKFLNVQIILTSFFSNYVVRSSLLAQSARHGGRGL